MTLIAPRYPGAAQKELIGGVKIVRLGSSKTVYFHAYFYYKKNSSKDRYDVIIEEINGNIAWFTPLYVKEPVVIIRHQVEYTGLRNLYRSVLPYELRLPIAAILYLNEAIYLKLYARLRVPFVTVSQSTKKDLVRAGITPELVYVVPNGLNVKPLEKVNDAQKEDKPTIMFIGRLQKSKGILDLIKSYKMAKRKIHHLQLWIAGDGPLRNQIQTITQDDSLIKTLGRVTEDQKIRLLKKAHILVTPSIREGWGQIVLEANACGVPAIGYDVPGLRDSIRDGKTGMLVEFRNIRLLVKAILKIFGDVNLRHTISKNALEYSEKFDWDKTSDKFLRVIKRIAYRKRSRQMLGRIPIKDGGLGSKVFRNSCLS